MHNDVNPFALEPAAPVHRWTLAEYLEHPAPSRSLLWDFYRSMSPYHFRWDRDNDPERETDAMTLGSAIHLAVLEPEHFDTRAIVWNLATMKAASERLGVPMPEKSTARAGKLWAALKAECAPARILVLTQAQYDTAHRLAEWVRSRKGIRRLFAEGLVEVSIVAQDTDTGGEYKVRIDFGDGERGWIVEVKSTRTLEPWDLFRATKDHGYHVQAAMQLDAAAAADLPIREHFTFWICTTGAPWARLTETPKEAIEEGRRIFRESLAGWMKCTESGEWPTPKFEREPLIWEEVR